MRRCHGCMAKGQSPVMPQRQQFEVPRPPPIGVPNVDADEAIAIGLSLIVARDVNPCGPMVKAVLDALRLAGWEIVPKVK